MPRIQVDIEATAGSTVGRADAIGHSVFARSHHADGWPIGWGHVLDTLDASGAPLEALVLMTEPALPGRVQAWPIGVIRLHEGASGQVLTCVTEAAPFMTLIDLARPTHWHADADAWVHALRRLRKHPHIPRHIQGVGDRRLAEELARIVHDGAA